MSDFSDAMLLIAEDAETIESLRAEIQALRRRIDAQEITIAQQAAHMATDADTIKRLEDAATAYRAEIEVDNMLHNAQWKMLAARDEAVTQLRAALEAVPLQAIFRFVQGTMYDPRANVDDYMPEHYDADRAAIDAWLRKELSAE